MPIGRKLLQCIIIRSNKTRLACRIKPRAAHRMGIAAGCPCRYMTRFRDAHGNTSSAASVNPWWMRCRRALMPDMCRDGYSSPRRCPLCRKKGDGTCAMPDTMPPKGGTNPRRKSQICAIKTYAGLYRAKYTKKAPPPHGTGPGDAFFYNVV